MIRKAPKAASAAHESSSHILVSLMAERSTHHLLFQERSGFLKGLQRSAVGRQVLHLGTRLGVAEMAKGEQRGNREAKKPKAAKPKTNAAAPSTKGSVSSSTGSKK
jgi:hypothetical protein